MKKFVPAVAAMVAATLALAGPAEAKPRHHHRLATTQDQFDLYVDPGTNPDSAVWLFNTTAIEDSPLDADTSGIRFRLYDGDSGVADNYLGSTGVAASGMHLGFDWSGSTVALTPRLEVFFKNGSVATVYVNECEKDIATGWVRTQVNVASADACTLDVSGSFNNLYTATDTASVWDQFLADHPTALVTEVRVLDQQDGKATMDRANLG